MKIQILNSFVSKLERLKKKVELLEAEFLRLVHEKEFLHVNLRKLIKEIKKLKKEKK